MSDNSAFDVVIVGGRPAGASLAARLGARGYRVALVDRARFPSPPAVPSSPVLYPSSMYLLDELGVPESDYAHAIARASQFRFEFDGRFSTILEVPSMWGRNYVCGALRSSFDEVLWRNVARFPSVERREGFAVKELLRDADGRVNGVVGCERGGPDEQIFARCVVGADGRFSLVARKAGASIVEQETDCCSTVYYAEWETPASVSGPTQACVYTTGRGLDVLTLPIPGGREQINTHQRSDRVDIEGDAQRYYLSTLQSIAGVAERLRGARQLGRVVGIKQIGNGYRQASGPGWALVGDAVHYKDPADGQGIYDALLGAKLLDSALAPYLAGEQSWEQAMSAYDRELHAATHPMYRETVRRLRRELYDEPPAVIIETLIRWMMTDPAYQARFMNYLGRTISPTGWISPRLVGGAVLRGLWRDITGRSAAAPG